MTGAIVHRGPDGSGFYQGRSNRRAWTLGMRRLSFIDLDPATPIFNRPLGRAGVQRRNLKYVELRAALQPGPHFRTQADTEVVSSILRGARLDLFAELRGLRLRAVGRARRRLVWRSSGRDQPLYLAGRAGGCCSPRRSRRCC